jgi:hypothetical protein
MSSYLPLRATAHSHQLFQAGRFSQPVGILQNRRHDLLPGHLVKLASGHSPVHRSRSVEASGPEAEVSWLVFFGSAQGLWSYRHGSG